MTGRTAAAIVLAVLGTPLAASGDSPGEKAPVPADGFVIVAGQQPDARPALAPKIENFGKDGPWFDRALAGISEPYPWSLRFLDDQEAWYTPFTRPGTPGRYDIRGRHRK